MTSVFVLLQMSPAHLNASASSVNIYSENVLINVFLYNLDCSLNKGFSLLTAACVGEKGRGHL